MSKEETPSETKSLEELRQKKKSENYKPATY